MILYLFSDSDDNGELTEAEFIALPPGDVEDPEQQKMDKDWQNERQKEFHNTIDSNKDGIATRKEIEVTI